MGSSEEVHIYHSPIHWEIPTKLRPTWVLVLFQTKIKIIPRFDCFDLCIYYYFSVLKFMLLGGSFSLMREVMLGSNLV